MTPFAGLLLLVAAAPAHTALAREATVANPIRRVVSMLQKMSEKVAEEGKQEEKLYEQFMCYCKTGTADLSATIDAAETKIPQVDASLTSAEELLKQLTGELAQHKADKKDAEDAVESATAQRKKEASSYAKASTDYTANILAIGKAIPALEKGMAGSFLQSAGAKVVRRLSIDMDMSPMDRDVISAFLSETQTAGYVPQAGQIVGILKQMKDSMEKDLSNAMATEESAIRDYDVIIAAKTKELKATQAAIESKTERSGETEVEITNLKEDLDDTTKTLAADKKFLAELTKGCSTKTAEWEARSKLRTQEVIALADTIKILNDDDALDLFKKTLPAPSLLELKVNGRQLKIQALSALRGKRAPFDHRLELVALALRGSSSGTFDKVVGMITKMVVLLGKEQKDDDSKKAYCEAELDKSEDDFKILNQKLADLEKAIAEAKEMIDTLEQDIAALEKATAELDDDVKDATATRKAENTLYKTTMAENTAALEILKMAKNRLAKFYTPKMYAPPAKKELSAAGAIERNYAFVQVHRDADVEAPPPPPETWDAYAKKGEENAGVTEMMQLLVTDLSNEITEFTTEENESQKEYEAYMKDAASARAANSQSIKDKTATKADAEASLVKLGLENKDTLKAAYDQSNLIKDLHSECDWLLANFGARRAARTGEVESLKDAKAVLSGSDFSLVQRGAVRQGLRGLLRA